MAGFASPDPATFNPYAHLRAAALGDLQALRSLSSAACVVGVADRDIVAFAEALVFGRLAFALSRSEQDATHIAAVVMNARESCPEEAEACANWGAEVLALADKLADEGDEGAGCSLSAMVDNAGAEAARAAKGISRLMVAL